ncbi:hypothetical protein HX056_00980 [Myroides odoratimimus]|uniref:hypothetical protein n=1 Tax=Myroides odoratimimus TaxID=76832 RepID=UPI002577B112|nr:hypothetical protein [Myroides odoratimimus]MDM1441912.1 hypothetical protein [Myroides odoratimimus]
MIENLHHLNDIIKNHNVTKSNINAKIDQAIAHINEAGLLNEKGQIVMDSNAIRNSLSHLANLADYKDILELSNKGEIDLPKE